MSKLFPVTLVEKLPQPLPVPRPQPAGLESGVILNRIWGDPQTLRSKS